MLGGDSASGRQKQALDLAEVDADEGICAPISLVRGLQAIGWQPARVLSSRPSTKSGAPFPQHRSHALHFRLWLLLLFMTCLGQVGGVKVGYQDTGYPRAQQQVGTRLHFEASELSPQARPLVLPGLLL